MYQKKKKNRRYCDQTGDFRLIGLLLAAFGIITICAFILPVKIWIVLLGIVLSVSGIFLLIK